jgi:hypothetical protein
MLNYTDNADVLNALIPQDDDGNPLLCYMFDWNAECRGQMMLTADQARKDNHNDGRA